MKQFAIESGMLTMRGVFYPTGYIVLMFPTEKDARDAERKLEANGHSGEHICLLTPDEMLKKIGATIGRDDIELPSPGTEAETVRHYAHLADLGHYTLFIHAPSHAETEHIMQVLREAPISYGQKYRHLVIEDLVDYVAPEDDAARRH